jgi:acyl-CoA thioesterase-2
LHEKVAELLDLLHLERIEDNIFRGQSRDIGTRFVFGGQVLGQALSATQHTVDPTRHANSLHAYFLRAGDIDHPIIYQVDKTRDGGSFSVRRVTAIQHGQPIFVMSASFHRPAKTQRWLARQGAFEFRHVYPRNELAPTKRPPSQQVWFRLTNRIDDTPALHQALLAYASDFHLVGTSTLPHAISYLQPNVRMASLDHALWFHRPLRVDEWLLYSCDSPSMQDSRGLSRGSIYTRDGVLVASTAQEGMIRVSQAGD